MLTCRSASRLLFLSLLSLVLMIAPGLSQEAPSPYQTAVVGDWLKYETTLENPPLPNKTTSIFRVTKIEGDIVTVLEQSMKSDGGEAQAQEPVTHTMDRSKPWSL